MAVSVPLLFGASSQAHINPHRRDSKPALQWFIPLDLHNCAQYWDGSVAACGPVASSVTVRALVHAFSALPNLAPGVMGPGHVTQGTHLLGSSRMLPCRS